MSYRIDIDHRRDHGRAERRAEPVMPGACRSGGCGGGAATRTPPPPSFGEVRVNGVEITPEAIAREMQHHPAPDPRTAWTEAARALAVRELLLQEARRLEIEAAPEADEAGRMEADDDALIRTLLDETIEPEPPGEAACRRFYEGRRAFFRTPDLFEVSHILIEPGAPDEGAWAAAEAQARIIADRVGDDARAFAAAARELSSCPSSHQDGSLGQVRRGELVPSIQAAVEGLAEGQTRREPARSRFGWHVIRLQRRIAGRALPFEAVRAKIAEMLGARSWSIAATRYVAALANNARIEGVAIEPPSESGRPVMPMLGDLLAAARGSAGVFPAWLEAHDPELTARVADAALRAGESPSAYVRAAVADFARFASEEDWATLVSRLRNSNDPGADCLRVMVEWRLAASDACSTEQEARP